MRFLLPFHSGEDTTSTGLEVKFKRALEERRASHQLLFLARPVRLFRKGAWKFSRKSEIGASCSLADVIPAQEIAITLARSIRQVAKGEKNRGNWRIS